MKHNIRRLKSLEVALKELEPYVRDGSHLQTGKPFRNFGGLRSREVLANWLLCAVMTAAGQGQFEFTTDPTGGDGVIMDAATDHTWLTEHVMVADIEPDRNIPIEDRILGQIQNKVAKGGSAYAQGKTLLVFNNAAGGAWYPNRVARALPDPLHFDTVWVMGLQGIVDGAYVYGVCNLSAVATADCPSFRVRLTPAFDGWTVERIQ
jgi:hypothetical protein